jgi:hypothetical protein
VDYNDGLLTPADDYIVEAGVLIVPMSHELCKDIRYVCTAPVDERPPVHYTCDDFLSDSSSTRRQLLRSSSSSNSYQQVFTQDPSTSPYMILPAYHGFCGGKLKSCEDKRIDFEKGGDDRTLNAGDFIKNDWYFTHNGLTITAKSQPTDLPLVPKIFDSSHPGATMTALGSPNKDCSPDGTGEGIGGMVGSIGQNCDYLGNILIASKASPMADPENGILTFAFETPIESLHGVGLLNVMASGNAIEIIQADGAQSFLRIESVDENGYQFLPINMDNVKQFSLYLSANAAVTELSFCT